ncbi:MAG: hypothetical protein N3B10_02830 [Armatimonadetes bacterium]|nr:hypothetical protein [Armatimonadota bacterium]
MAHREVRPPANKNRRWEGETPVKPKLEAHRQVRPPEIKIAVGRVRLLPNRIWFIIFARKEV